MRQFTAFRNRSLQSAPKRFDQSQLAHLGRELEQEQGSGFNANP